MSDVSDLKYIHEMIQKTDGVLPMTEQQLRQEAQASRKKTELRSSPNKENIAKKSKLYRLPFITICCNLIVQNVNFYFLTFNRI